jgi:ribose transport system substrate-binding protein
MNRRRLLALAGGSPLALFLSGCNRSTKKTIGVIPKGRAHVFWQSVNAGAIAASREHDVDIVWNGPATEAEFNTQIQIVDAMIARRVDAIALAPIDSEALAGVVNRAADAKIPVIIFDSGVNSERFTAQVATDNYAAGALAAERMGEILKGQGQIVVVAVQVGAASTMAREQGFADTIAKKFPGIRILDKRYGKADYAESLKVAENMLTAHPKLDGMFASNESSTAGAVQALKARKSAVKLVGFDSSEPLLEDLKNGAIDSLVTQHPFQMGHDCVVAAVKAIRGEAVERIQNIAPLVVTTANLGTPEVQARVRPDLKKYLQ